MKEDDYAARVALALEGLVPIAWMDRVGRCREPHRPTRPEMFPEHYERDALVEVLCMADTLAAGNERGTSPTTRAHRAKSLRRPTCCVDISGETDLTLEEASFADWHSIMADLVTDYSDRARLEEMSPVAYARSDSSTLLLHSDGDGNVFVRNADLMQKALAEAGAEVRYCRFAGWAHGDDVFLECAPARSEISSFLTRKLGAP